MYKISSFCSTDGCVGVGTFATSSFCNGGTCVEIGAWDKSSFSASGNCIEIGAWNKSSQSFSNGNCVETGAWDTSSFSSFNGSCAEVGAPVKASFCADREYVEIGAWGKSSLSGLSECVEAGAPVKSSFSTCNGQSVEAEAQKHVIVLRDTKKPGPAREGWDQEEWEAYMAAPREPVIFSLPAWQEWIMRIKAGEFPVVPGTERYAVGNLVFDTAEWDAFVKGVNHVCDDGRGEFDLSPELEQELLSPARA